MKYLKPLAGLVSLALTHTSAAAEKVELPQELNIVVKRYAEASVNEFWKIVDDKEGELDFVDLMKQLTARSRGEEHHDHDEDDHDHEEEEHRETFGKAQVQRLKMLDLNGDFKLSREESLKGVYHMMAEQCAKMLPLDGNGDGALSMEELSLSIPAARSNDPKEQEIRKKRAQSRFQFMDTDKDGKITFPELVGANAQFFIQTGAVMQLAYRVPLLDSNQNGEIDPEEIPAALSSWKEKGHSLPLNKIYADIVLLKPQEMKVLDQALNKK